MVVGYTQRHAHRRETNPHRWASPFMWFRQGQLSGIAVPIINMVIAFVVGALVLARTGYGRVIFAIGGSEESTALMGLPVDRTKGIVYTTSGALAGLSGTLLVARFSAGDPNAGLVWELDAISAVVVGGTLLAGGSWLDEWVAGGRTSPQHTPELDQPARNPGILCAAAGEWLLPYRRGRGASLPDPQANLLKGPVWIF